MPPFSASQTFGSNPEQPRRGEDGHRHSAVVLNAPGLELERFDYSRIGSAWAVVRLMLRLGAEADLLRAPLLSIDGTDDDVPHLIAARARRLERRLSTGAHPAGPVLWRGAFALPVDLTEDPAARFALLDCEAEHLLALPVPTLRVITPRQLELRAAPAERATVRHVRRRAGAIATLAALTTTSTPAAAFAATAESSKAGTSHAGGSTSSSLTVAGAASAAAGLASATTGTTSGAAGAAATATTVSAPAKTAAAATKTATTKTTPATTKPTDKDPVATTATAPPPTTTPARDTDPVATTGTPPPATHAASGAKSVTTSPATPTTTAATHASGGAAIPVTASGSSGATVVAGGSSTTGHSSTAHHATAHTGRLGTAKSVHLSTAPAQHDGDTHQHVTPAGCTSATAGGGASMALASNSRTRLRGSSDSTVHCTPTAPHQTTGASAPTRWGQHAPTHTERHHHASGEHRASSPRSSHSDGGVPLLSPTPPFSHPSDPTTTTGPTTSTPVPGLTPTNLAPTSWTGTTSSNPALTGTVENLSGLLSNGNRPPSFLIPIYMQAARHYSVPWQVLAAINAIESDYGRDLSTSTAGAVGWMQFEPSTWKQYGVAADGHSVPNPYDPRDAIFSAARYLRAAGGNKDIERAVFAYNHAGWYVDEVMQRATAIAQHAQFQQSQVSRGGTVSVSFAATAADELAAQKRAKRNAQRQRDPTVRYTSGLSSSYAQLITAANLAGAAQFPYLWGAGYVEQLFARAGVMAKQAHIAAKPKTQPTRTDTFAGLSLSGAADSLLVADKHTQQPATQPASSGSLVSYSGGVLSHYDRLITAANMVSAADFPYLWGGGHETPARFGPFDCSGSVSYVMQQAGYGVPTTVSGDIPSWHLPAGPGRVTIFYNPVHTFMRIGNRFFGTSGFARPGGGAGWFDVDKLPAGYLAGFNEVHVPDLGSNSFAAPAGAED